MKYNLQMESFAELMIHLNISLCDIFGKNTLRHYE